MSTHPTKSEEFNSLKHALDRLGEALNEKDTGNRIVFDATIKRYEFAIELFGKTLEKFTEHEGFTCNTPRENFTMAYELGWIDNEHLWIGMIQDRNRTSHTYHEQLADEIIKRIPDYYQAMLAGYANLENCK